MSRDIAVQGYKGKKEENSNWDFSLLPVVGVFFCNFRVTGLSGKPLITARLRDDESGEPIGRHQRYAFIQLPCFDKAEDKCSTGFDKWIFNLKHMGPTQTVAFATDNEVFNYLKTVSNVAALPPREREIYEACLMRARDYNAQMKYAKNEARAEGRAEGRAEEKAKTMETMRRLLEMGIQPDMLARASGMSIDELTGLSL